MKLTASILSWAHQNINELSSSHGKAGFFFLKIPTLKIPTINSSIARGKFFGEYVAKKRTKTFVYRRVDGCTPKPFFLSFFTLHLVNANCLQKVLGQRLELDPSVQWGNRNILHQKLTKSAQCHFSRLSNVSMDILSDSKCRAELDARGALI